MARIDSITSSEPESRGKGGRKVGFVNLTDTTSSDDGTRHNCPGPVDVDGFWRCPIDGSSARHSGNLPCHTKGPGTGADCN